MRLNKISDTVNHTLKRPKLRVETIFSAKKISVTCWHPFDQISTLFSPSCDRISFPPASFFRASFRTLTWSAPSRESWTQIGRLECKLKSIFRLLLHNILGWNAYVELYYIIFWAKMHIWTFITSYFGLKCIVGLLLHNILWSFIL